MAKQVTHSFQWKLGIDNKQSGWSVAPTSGKSNQEFVWKCRGVVMGLNLLLVNTPGGLLTHLPF